MVRRPRLRPRPRVRPLLRNFHSLSTLFLLGRGPGLPVRGYLCLGPCIHFQYPAISHHYDSQVDQSSDTYYSNMQLGKFVHLISTIILYWSDGIPESNDAEIYVDEYSPFLASKQQHFQLLNHFVSDTYWCAKSTRWQWIKLNTKDRPILSQWLPELCFHRCKYPELSHGQLGGRSRQQPLADISVPILAAALGTGLLDSPLLPSPPLKGLELNPTPPDSEDNMSLGGGSTGGGGVSGNESSSLRCLLVGGNFLSLSLRWQNHIWSCRSERPVFTDSSARSVSDGYASTAPKKTKITITQPIDPNRRPIEHRNPNTKRGGDQQTGVGLLEDLQLVRGLHLPLGGLVSAFRRRLLPPLRRRRLLLPSVPDLHLLRPKP
ncbi:hypothetical protein MUK42_03389 [Musa troglodytarum]|uniref:Uncharacterized protein n=1 Tax=Musa troglodytarum TaxID=320322 RepID=A0A9E7H0X2_9LILI|nr:hypothetical protein MUK42_03389 [Musa troglodytarum]